MEEVVNCFSPVGVSCCKFVWTWDSWGISCMFIFHLSINHCISGNFNLIRCVWKHDETMFNKKFLRSMQKYRSNLGVASVLPCLLINAFTTTIAFLFKNQVFSKSGSLTNFTFSYVIVKLDKHKMEIYH